MFVATLWVMLVLTVVTAVTRFVKVWRQASGKTPRPVPVATSSGVTLARSRIFGSERRLEPTPVAAAALASLDGQQAAENLSSSPPQRHGRCPCTALSRPPRLSEASGPRLLADKADQLGRHIARVDPTLTSAESRGRGGEGTRVLWPLLG